METLDLSVKIAKDTAEGVYGKFTSSYNMLKGLVDGKYELADNLTQIGDNAENWKEYFISSSYSLMGRWAEIVVRYQALLSNRENMGLPLFDGPGNDQSMPGWTREDDAYLMALHDIISKISKYTGDLQSGVRLLAWDLVSQDAVVLGVETEPSIKAGRVGGTTPVSYDPRGGDILVENFSKGQVQRFETDFGVSGGPLIVAGVIVGGVLYSVIALGAIYLLIKATDLVSDHLARAEAADIRRQQDMVINSCISRCPKEDKKCFAECTGQAIKLTEATTAAIKTTEKAREERNEKSDTKEFSEMIKTVSFVALGIAGIGLTGYLVYRFAGSRSPHVSESRLLSQGSPIMRVPVLSSRDVELGGVPVGEPVPKSVGRIRIPKIPKGIEPYAGGDGWEHVPNPGKGDVLFSTCPETAKLEAVLILGRGESFDQIPGLKFKWLTGPDKGAVSDTYGRSFWYLPEARSGGRSIGEPDPDLDAALVCLARDLYPGLLDIHVEEWRRSSKSWTVQVIGHHKSTDPRLAPQLTVIGSAKCSGNTPDAAKQKLIKMFQARIRKAGSVGEPVPKSVGRKRTTNRLRTLETIRFASSEAADRYQRDHAREWVENNKMGVMVHDGDKVYIEIKG